ncbi:MAG: ATP-binding protein [Pseudomonadota bacterium]
MDTREFTDLLEDGVVVIDAKLNILLCNHAATHRFGFTDGAGAIPELVPEAQLPDWHTVVERAVKEGTFRTTLEGPDTQKVRLYASRTGEGNVLLTLRRPQEAAAQERVVNAYAAVLARYGIGLWRNDLSTGELWWSPKCYELLDMPEGPVSTAAYLEKLSREDQANIGEQIHQQATGAGEYAPCFKVPHDGGVRHLQDRTELLQRKVDDAGPVFIGATLDRTPIVDLEARCEELEARLRDTEAVRATSQLAGAMAHDLNNVMTALLGNAELLSLKTQDPQHAEHLQAIGVGVRHASALASRMLDFVRKRPLSPAQLNLGDLVNENLTFLRALIPETVAIECRMRAGDVTIRGDRHQLEQALYNLILNAGQASKGRGRIVISVGTRGDSAVLSIEDNGKGITKADQERIFDPFYSSRTGGAGLGLSSVRQIAEHHNGSISIHSEKGVGSTFEITLPLSASDDEPGVTETASHTAGGLTIWIAEDDNMVRVVLEQLLNGAQHRVHAFARPTDLLARLHAGVAPPDLVITDVVMPEMSGPDLLDKIREREPDLRVLFISGYADDQLLAKFDRHIEAGNLLQKPFKRQDLFAAIEDIMRRSAVGA